MAIDSTAYELIDRYLSGELSPEEKSAFEARLGTDAELRDTLALYRGLQQDYSQMATTRQQEANLSHTLEQLSKKHFGKEEQKPAKIVSMSRRWYAVAAAASLVLLFFLVKPLIWSSGEKNLFDSYYEEEPLSVQRGQADSAIDAIQFFNKKEYTKALVILEPFTNAHADATDLQLAKGTCYMQTGQYEKALPVFTDIATGETVYKDRARWLHALLMLKQEKTEDCKTALQAVPENSTYYKKAQKLIREL